MAKIHSDRQEALFSIVINPLPASVPNQPAFGPTLLCEARLCTEILVPP